MLLAASTSLGGGKEIAEEKRESGFPFGGGSPLHGTARSFQLLKPLCEFHDKILRRSVGRLSIYPLISCFVALLSHFKAIFFPVRSDSETLSRILFSEGFFLVNWIGICYVTDLIIGAGIRELLLCLIYYDFF